MASPQTETAVGPAGEAAPHPPASFAGLVLGLIVALLCGLAWLWGVEGYFGVAALAGGALALGCGIYLYAGSRPEKKVGGSLLSTAAKGSFHNAAAQGAAVARQGLAAGLTAAQEGAAAQAAAQGAAMMQRAGPAAAQFTNVANAVRPGAFPGVPMGMPRGVPMGMPPGVPMGMSRGVPMGGVPPGMELVEVVPAPQR